MELKQVVINNGGMSQDLSISKQDNKLAFENKNIRIQATDDGTLLSVTNIKNPKTLKINLGGIFSVVILGGCVTPEYLVIFAKRSRSPYAKVPTDNDPTDNDWSNWDDFIYRISLDSIENGVDGKLDNPEVKVLYDGLNYGNLNFDVSSYFDTLYYEEGKNVKKVYWTDNVNNPRVINIITPSERNGGNFASYESNIFDFYPVAFSEDPEDPSPIPEINVTKNRDVTSELPAGVVQYFVSYYWLNGAETLIAASSDTFTIDYSNRGGKADESGMCAFDIEIPADTVNHSFDYMRVYSVVRTTLNGPLTVKIVGDIRLVHDGTEPDVYKITDTGIGQEQLDAGHLFFIGGSPFVAKTLTEKDDTLFVGGIKTKEVEISSDLETEIVKACRTNKYNGDESSATEDDVNWWTKNGIIDFHLNKSIPNTPSQFNSFYPYKLQLDKGSSTYKTFKSGEIYRFGIQFQTAQGEWSTVVWIGDKECTKRPVYDEETQCFKVNNAEFQLPDTIIDAVKAAGFVNYRIVIADPEKHNGRKIKMQGLLNPTMFTPGQRALDAPYALPSWIMRPRKGTAAYHHFEPLFSTEVSESELASYTPDEKETIEEQFKYQSTAYIEGYTAAWGDKNAIPPAEYRTTENPYYIVPEGESEADREIRIKNGAEWDSGYDVGWKEEGTPRSLVTYDVTTKVNKTKYTKPYIEEDDHDGKPGYVVTCFTVSPGNQLAIRSVKVWSDDANNNFYDSNGDQPAKENYKVLCDYAGSIGGLIYNNYGTITDVITASAVATPSAESIEHNVYDVYTWDDYNCWPYLYWSGKEWSKSGGTWTSEYICDPIFYGLTEAFKREGIDLRLIPEPSLFAAVASQLTKSAVGDAFLAIAYAIIAAAVAILVAAIGVISGGTFFAAVAATGAILASCLALGVAVPTAAGLGVEAEREHKSTSTLYSTDTIISQKNLRKLIGASYDSLPDFQRVLMSKRYFPLYSTAGNGPNGNFYRVIDPLTVYVAGDGSWFGHFDKIVFSKTKGIYYTNDANYTSQSNGLITIPDIFRPHAGHRPTTWNAWSESATYIQIFPISVGSTFNTEITKEYNNYYIDESYVTLNSPDAEDFNYGTETLKLRAVGAAPLTTNYADVSVKVNKSASTVERGLDYNLLYNKHRTTSIDKDGLLTLNSDYLYLDAGWNEEATNVWKLAIGYPAKYKVYLFSPNNYLGISKDSELGDAGTSTIGDFPGTTVKQQILNHNFSKLSRYFKNPCDYGDVHFGIAYDDTALGVSTGTDLITYYPKYENAILKGDMSHHYMYLEDKPTEPGSADLVAPTGNKKAQGSVSLTFNSTPHIFIDLQKPNDISQRGILPFFQNEIDDYYRLSGDLKRYVWEDNIEEDIISITGHKQGDPSIPIPDADKTAIKDYLVQTEYHTQKGLWKQNSGELKSSYSIWDKGAVYHCGKYFIKDENNPNVGDIVNQRQPTGNEIRDFLEHVRQSMESYTSDQVFCSILLAGLIASDPDTTQTIHTIDLNAEYAKNIPDIIVGSHKYYSWSVIDPYQHYATKFRTTSIQIYAEYIPGTEEVEGQWALVKPESGPDITVAGSTIQRVTLYLNTWDNPDKIVPNDDIYLNKLDETQPRFTFSLEDWWHGSPEYIPHDRGTKEGPRESSMPYEQYKDFRIKYEAPEIDEDAPTTPYLFIGELYQDIDHDILYGGYDSHALRLLSWYPISKTMPILEVERDTENPSIIINNPNVIKNTEGDTYYQRWDCLKTYPVTEEDVNQVVDITSFMVETHKNLDARCDINRATFSLMARPTNFNLFNLVYNQPNNIFEYATDWSELNSTNIPNEIAWSLTKNFFGDVDTWTNITLENSTRTTHPVTKLLNWNNQVMALTEHAMEIVNFNAKNLVPSADNTFIELQNSSKVDGTIRLQNPYGTHNMSTLITEQGLYFIEDNEKTLIRINGEGPKKIGISKLIDWFHNNVVQGTHTFSNGKPFHLEYDIIHKDIYIKNEDTCLVYNELLDEFTSILTYSGDYWLFNYGGNLYAYRMAYTSDNNTPYVGMYKMFAGDSYNKDFGRYYKTSNEEEVFDDGSPMEYSVEYVINPNSYSDKVFTNGILAADLGVVPDNSKKENGVFPFNTVQMWNEYQDTGIVPLQKILDKPSNLKDKFRFWKFIVPRDSKSPKWPKDRIRNPWARIKLVGDSTNKMEFHNMTIQYME